MSRLCRELVRLRAAPGVWLVPFWACAALVLPAAAARAQVLSVAQFNAKVERWRSSNAEPPDVALRVEGRVVLLARDRLRLRNCPVPFVAGDQLPEFDRAVKNVEVGGRVVRDAKSGEYQFVVAQARALPDDHEVFHERRRALRQAGSEQWHQLGEWAVSRGKFYNDQNLVALGEEAHVKGIVLEREALAGGQPEPLFELAERAKALAVRSSVIQEIIHEGCLSLWRQSRGQKGAELAGVLEQLRQRLPGAKEPLPYRNASLASQYFERPQETYSKAGPAARRELHRLLYIDVLMRTLPGGDEADGTALLELAAQIDQLVPEYHHLAEKYREQALDQALELKAQDLERLSRGDVLKLSEEYRGRQRAEMARQVVERWLALRLKRLDPDDTEGLIELTGEYRTLLGEQNYADRLLIEAHARNPKATDLAAVLEARGLHWHEGRWLTAEQYLERPESRFERAIRSGRVEPGMNQAQVRRALGEPTSIARSVTSGCVTEIWRYELADQSRLVLRLERRGARQELLLVR